MAITITEFSIDTGLEGDRRTNDKSILLTGLADPNDLVRVWADDLLLGTTSADANGNWSFTTPELVDGAHRFVAETGEEGNTQASDPFVLEIDTVTLAPEITSIQAGEGGLNLFGTAEAGAAVELFRDGALIGTVTTAASGIWDYADAGYAGGSVTYTARATDVAGNTAEMAAGVPYSPPSDAPAETVSDGLEPADGGVAAASTTPVILEKRVAAAGDDVEERGTGSWSSNTGDLEMVMDGTSHQTVGIRFTGLDIPKGAVITNAYIQFRADEVKTGAASLTIQGHDTDDAAVFTSTRYDLSSRPRTDASAAWAPADWTVRGEASLAQRTTDLSAIVQEIVNRPGWALTNDMAFIITGTAGTRTATSYEGGAANAPLLHVEYYVPDGGGGGSPVVFQSPADANSNPDQIAELAAAGTLVGITAAAADPDAGDTVSYSISDSRFAIDAATGVVTRSGTGTLDFETQPSVSFTVTATSTDGSTASQDFTLSILDSPEASGPVAFNSPADADSATNRIADSAAAGTLVGITAAASDPDAGDTVSYSIDDTRFAIDPSTGVITRSSTGTLDAQNEPSVTLTVTATSSDGSVDSEAFDLAVASGSTSQPTSLTLVKTVQTSQWSPASPDPSGLAYISHLGTLMVADGEVDEMSIFAGKNVFQMSLGGQLTGSFSTTSYSDEPAGVAYNPANRHIFFSDDTGTKRVYELNPGGDGLYGTSDDLVTSFKTSGFGSSDPEGLAYDTKRGMLYVVDGSSDKLHAIAPGSNGRFDGTSSVGGDDVVASYALGSLGINDPEGVEYDPVHDLLYVTASRTKVAMLSPTAQLLGTLDISAAGVRKPAGLALAPSSEDSSQMSLYLADRGVDNDSNPNENDGKVYEFLINDFLVA